MGGWAGPAWGEPSGAAASPARLRRRSSAPWASYRADGGRSDQFLVLAASVSGVSHRLAGRRGEDSFGWALPEPGRLGLVVADGVGSAGRGGEGAELAVDAACRYLTGGAEHGWDLASCWSAISEANRALYEAGGEAPAGLATTIVVALVRAGAGEAEVALGRVGDSSAFVLSPEGEWQELFGASGGAGAGPAQAAGTGAANDADGPMLVTATASLPLASMGPAEGGGPRGLAGAEAGPGGGPVEMASAALGRGAALALVTDGVAQPLRDGPTTVAPRLAEALRAGGEGGLGPLGLAYALDFSRRGAHDDRTVLVAWPLARQG